jgi:uncharacterized protein YgiM (DUF1202 family)
MHRIVFLFIIILTSLLLQACGSAEAAVSTALAQTQQISELQTAAAEQSFTDTPQPTDIQGTATNTPTLATATSSIPYVSVSVDTHCRSGPRVDYKLLTTILVGEQVIVLATYPNGDYVVVQRAGGAGSCWLWLRYADHTDFSGYNLPVATQPPTSTPTFTPSPTPTPTYTFTPTPTP